MKRAVSISIGSSKRNKTVDVNLFGEQVRLERIGTDGDMKQAAALYRELDGKVDAFGVGGAVLGLMIDDRWHTLPNVQSLVQGVKKTPVVDGTGLKMTLECRAVGLVDELIARSGQPKRAFLISGVDRYGLTSSFVNAGYESIIGDLMFALGVPLPLHSLKSLKRVANALIPVLGRLPFKWLYPVGDAQNVRAPKWQKYYDWCTLIAGDCHYITHTMPDDLAGRIIVTNTTTMEDRDLFSQAGVKYLITSTPVLEGRSFGTNMMEAAILAALGCREPVDYANAGEHLRLMNKAIDDLHMKPQLMEL